jgi:hypothetical protein
MGFHPWACREEEGRPGQFTVEVGLGQLEIDVNVCTYSTPMELYYLTCIESRKEVEIIASSRWLLAS